jgi:hypothetical protein
VAKIVQHETPSQKFHQVTVTAWRFTHDCFINPSKSRRRWGIAIAAGTGVTNWPRVERVLGETVREVGILIVVFAPLEATFSEVPVSMVVVAAMFFLGVVLAAGGIIMETRE